MVAEAECSFVGELIGIALNGDRSGRPSALVVADHVDVDAVRAAIADQVALLEKRRRHAGEHHVKGDRLDVVRFEPDTDLIERLNDLVDDRSDSYLLRCQAKLATAS